MAEDNDLDVELALEALQDYNLANHVIVVKDGVEAMEFLHKEGKYKNRKDGNPGVLLLDIKMPRMNGIEVLTALRGDKKLSSIPVVMLTSSREEPDLKRCYELGVNAYVVKPVAFKDFLEAVKHIGFFWAMLNEQPQCT
ncbi:MAG TPA: response regulator [Bacteroidales bacterium]|nr:response regulator [Bacteroidales bacterium]